MAQAITAGSTAVATTVSVSNSASTAVLSANPSRKGLVLSNLGANDIYVRLDGGTASSTAGTLLPSGGAPLVLLQTCPVGAITAIAATGATNLSVTELT